MTVQTGVILHWDLQVDRTRMTMSKTSSAMRGACWPFLEFTWEYITLILEGTCTPFILRNVDTGPVHRISEV